MLNHQKVFTNFLTQNNFSLLVSDSHDLQQRILTEIKNFDSVVLAEIFIDSSFLSSSIKFLSEEHWLQKKEKDFSESKFYQFVENCFEVELKPIAFLLSTFSNLSFDDFNSLEKISRLIEETTTNLIKQRPYRDQKVFVTQCLHRMTILFNFEEALQSRMRIEGRFLGLSLYKTFDLLDEILKLNYEIDHGMKVDLKNTERLYEGAGAGVQSGYSTVLLALHNLNPKQGSRIVDLGSGYGRVGFIIGLLRPDMDFKGFEFVQHRVDNASNSSKNLEIDEHVQFFTQDLSLKEFSIPDADIYYLYDPFSDETYAHVLSQLVQISLKHKISIVTKGNARDWLKKIALEAGWPQPLEFDNTNLCLFSSQ